MSSGAKKRPHEDDIETLRSNKTKIDPNASAQESGSNANPIAVDSTDDDADDNVDSIHSDVLNCIHPIIPKVVNNASWIDPTRSLDFVIYLAISEPTDSPFTRGLTKCRDICDSTITRKCLQQDGTRHITMSTGRLTKEQANNIKFRDNSQRTKRPITVEFNGFQPWKGGIYLKLSHTTTSNLKKWLEGLSYPGGNTMTPKCDHLSLYRKRNAENKLYFSQCARLRSRVGSHDWGTVSGASIRIKQMGTGYDQCRVLWSV